MISVLVDPDPPTPIEACFLGPYGHGSVTTVRAASLGAGASAALFTRVGLDARTLDPGSEQADRLVVLRHTLMNPFVHDDENGISYIDRYFEFLEREVRTLAAATPDSRTEAAA